MVGDATFERMRPARPASRYSCDDNILALRHASDPQRGGGTRAASRVHSQPADQMVEAGGLEARRRRPAAACSELRQLSRYEDTSQNRRQRCEGISQRRPHGRR